VERRPAVLDILRTGLGELRIAPDRLVEPLRRLAELLASWSQRMNLTGHCTPQAIARRLILDAVALGAALPEPESLADVGSGAGFPGLPLALLWPGCRITLIESRERRHHFQRAAVRELALPNVRALLGRAELLVADPHAAVVAQAVSSPDAAATWMLPWAAPGALLLFPVSRTQVFPSSLPGVRDLHLIEYRVPLSGVRRAVWIGSRAQD
jgi:16S rRNA (guanine527-N7)-methyltransferase